MVLTCDLPHRTLRPYALNPTTLRTCVLICTAGGAASFQNGLELGHELLAGVPPYVHRELLFLMAALSTVDPGKVDDSITKCKDAKIRSAWCPQKSAKTI